MQENPEQEIDYFKKGSEAFEKGNYTEALHFFNISNNDNPSKEAEEYIQKCHEKIEQSNNSQNKDFKPSTPEDEECIQIINNNDYYDILGISKDASPEDMKKAYKKKAIKFHPDKNKSPKAEEAFKKISTAYQCLSDPKKKELFDKYGSEEEYREKVYKANQEKYQEEEMDEFDLFDMFFNNLSQEEILRRRRRFAQQRNRDNDILKNNPTLAKIIRIVQLIPLFLLALSYILPLFFGEKTFYNYQKSVEFPIEKMTKKMKVKYYINSDFMERFSNKNDLKKVEVEIENGYETYLNETCNEKKKNKEELKTKLIYYKKGSYHYNKIEKEYQQVDMKICETYDKFIKIKNGEIIDEDDE